MNETSETDLTQQVILAQKGDTAALTRLIRTSQDRLFRFCVYLAGDPNLAQDLCQDTYVRVFEKIGKLKEPDRFTSWLLKTAKNIYLDHVKSPKNGGSSLTLEDVADHPVLQDPSDRDLFIQIQEAMKGLKPDDRTILLLVDLEQYSYSEAAEIVGISESNLRFKLHHIRKHFSERFKK